MGALFQVAVSGWGVVGWLRLTVKANQNVCLESMHLIVRSYTLISKIIIIIIIKLASGLVTPFPGTLQSDGLTIKNSRATAETSSCLLFAESTPLAARAAAVSATRASFLFPLTYFPDK